MIHIEKLLFYIVFLVFLPQEQIFQDHHRVCRLDVLPVRLLALV
ncbi:hypothetical protein HMPREF0484_2400 [Klebsiella pneumoniae subsp. rhinoscleromatis ATCC 13884]|nr:hypothetical protein HMPREF0484_2400 [Klebsiella pneumoniae subsp. rhinoscleromatis ATCC 13884]